MLDVKTPMASLTAQWLVKLPYGLGCSRRCGKPKVFRFAVRKIIYKWMILTGEIIIFHLYWLESFFFEDL
jgi:hypothetical protein